MEDSGPDRDDRFFFLAGGSLGAILLGMVLVPARSLTTPSNFTFLFLALTIVVAELGGRGAALATAVCSALSLNFFLTKPYLSLQIEGKDDLIAFAGLGVCGLIAAALGSERGKRITGSEGARKHLDLLRTALAELQGGSALGPRLSRVLHSAAKTIPLAAAVVRDERGYLVASSERADEMRPVPDSVLVPDTLLPADADPRALDRDQALPRAGGRIALGCPDLPCAFLDVWGNRTPVDASSRRALSDLARLVSLFLAKRPAAPGNAR